MTINSVLAKVFIGANFNTDHPDFSAYNGWQIENVTLQYNGEGGYNCEIELSNNNLKQTIWLGPDQKIT
jgi:hypothetical protein